MELEVGSKILCPFHPDRNPSCHIFEDGYFCFVCEAHGPLRDLGATAKPGSLPKPKEDIKASLEYIDTLPRKVIRGLTLPYDDKGYYIVYPNVDYYVRRNWDDSNGRKYYNPAGFGQQLLIAAATMVELPLIVVEGQLNALTIDQAWTGYNGIVSPGAASNFNSRLLVNYCLSYRAVLIIVDKDAAGVMAGLKLKAELHKRGIRSRVHGMKPDLNDTYVEKGQEAVRQEIQGNLEMLERM